MDKSSFHETIDIALAPCDIGAVPGLVADISSHGNNLKGQNRAERLELLEKARSLVRALETPQETMMKHAHGDMVAFFCLALGNDVGLFKRMAASQGSAKSVHVLAEAVGWEVDLLRRVLRHVAAMGYLMQVSPDEYKPTNFTMAMAFPAISDGYPVHVYIYAKAFAQFSSWLKSNGNRCPTKAENNPHRFGNQTELPFFDWLQATGQAEQFHNHISGLQLGTPRWIDAEVYPVDDNLLAGFGHRHQGGDVMLVDIGGGYGHDLLEFRHKFPEAPSRLILEDRAPVLKGISEIKGVECVPYDLFTPQPITGARAYFMHKVMLDYPDDTCVTILEQVKPAMLPGYSKLLINEVVLPTVGASWEATSLDICVMAMFSSRQRTEDEWQQLLETRAGLKICRFWNPGNGIEAVIECELVYTKK